MPKRKLLLADDSITIQKVVNLTFADEGIEVVAVGDGDSAMEKLREESPDIVLADVNMPGLTGYEICAEIKGRDFGDQVPVILLVGSFEPFDEEEADRVGADGYLTKPFQSISLLVAKVSDLLGIESSPDPEFEDTAEFIDKTPETLSASMDSGSVEPSMPSFPDTLEGMISKKDPIEFPLNEDSESEEKEDFSDFDDADEFEMSEAFADDETIEEIDPAANDDSQIEEVSEDFLRTQPFTESDLQEIAVDEEVSANSVGDEFADATEPYSEEPADSLSFSGQAEESNDELKESGEPVFRVESSDQFEPAPEFGSIGEANPESSEENTLNQPFEDQPQLGSLAGNGEDETDSIVDQFETESASTDQDFTPESEFSSMEGDESDDDDDGFSFPAQFRDDNQSFPTEFENESSIDSSDDPETNVEEPETDVNFRGWDDDTGISESELPQPEGVSVLNLDEINLLELPPADDDDSVVNGVDDTAREEKGFDIASGESEFDEEIREPDPEIPVEEMVSKEVEPEQPQSNSTGDADGIPSKAMVEAVTRQVIETLSEKAIREIAWEVVPDLADLIIKKMAEEQMKD